MPEDSFLSPAFRVGDIELRRVVELDAPFRTPADAFPMDAEAATQAAEALRGRFEPWAVDPRSGKLRLVVQTYVLRTRRHVILVDTCVGCGKTFPANPAWHRRDDDGWLARLRAAGVAPEAVDFVLCTHLHGDHVGWNTRLENGRWVPTFPNAVYLMTEIDEGFIRHARPDTWRESVSPVIEAGQARLVAADHALDDEVWLEPTPGHTPGHAVVRLRSRGAEATLTGDAFHAPIQLLHPDWRFFADDDPVQAVATRKALLESHCETDRLVLPAHFPAPSIGHVTREGEAYGFRFKTP